MKKMAHVLIDQKTKTALDALGVHYHRSQTDLMDEACSSLVLKHTRPVTYREWSHDRLNYQLVFRIDPEKAAAVLEIARRTRVSISNLYREAIADLLKKHTSKN